MIKTGKAFMAVRIEVLLWLGACLLPASGATVSITWNPPIISNNVAGYSVHWGRASRVYAWTNNVGGNAWTTNVYVSNLAPTDRKSVV
jgi:hypothetical protein